MAGFQRARSQIFVILRAALQRPLLSMLVRPGRISPPVLPRHFNGQRAFANRRRLSRFCVFNCACREGFSGWNHLKAVSAQQMASQAGGTGEQQSQEPKVHCLHVLVAEYQRRLETKDLSTPQMGSETLSQAVVRLAPR
jgi:hypothetical protein